MPVPDLNINAYHPIIFGWYYEKGLVSQCYALGGSKDGKWYRIEDFDVRYKGSIIKSKDFNGFYDDQDTAEIDFIKGIHEFNTILFNFNVEEKFNISCDNFKILLQVTDYAAKDQTIPILQGVNFKQNKVCCLDGYRLALREFNDMDLEKSYTVQSSILSNLNSIVKKDSEIAIQFNERECNIKIGSLSVTSKLLEGKFINYEQIIPREFNIKAEVEQHELKEEIEFLLSLADDKNNQLLKFNMNNDKVTLLSKTTESSSDITLENATANGEIEIAFNTSFVYDMLKHFDNKIRFEIINSISPMICKCEEINGLDLILPMRIFK
jgi:DNA polymerase-3 subunit beta